MAKDGDTWSLGCLCGGPLLLVGAFLAVVAAGEREQGVLRVLAAAIAAMALTTGAGFTSVLLPTSWQAPLRLWRWAGWAPGLAIAVTGAVLLADPATASEGSRRVSSPTLAVLFGLVLLSFGGLLSWTWWRTVVQDGRPPR